MGRHKPRCNNGNNREECIDLQAIEAELRREGLDRPQKEKLLFNEQRDFSFEGQKRPSF